MLNTFNSTSVFSWQTFVHKLKTLSTCKISTNAKWRKKSGTWDNDLFDLIPSRGPVSPQRDRNCVKFSPANIQSVSSSKLHCVYIYLHILKIKTDYYYWYFKGELLCVAEEPGEGTTSVSLCDVRWSESRCFSGGSIWRPMAQRGQSLQREEKEKLLLVQ